ncbi:hypothetical protein BC833DRAFT_620307 [Globomyces pollinis-pini]|nr:hypothetical protein BC833DRAFT_620307 [Globomyces pollinis-pini]
MDNCQSFVVNNFNNSNGINNLNGMSTDMSTMESLVYHKSYLEIVPKWESIYTESGLCNAPITNQHGLQLTYKGLRCISFYVNIQTVHRCQHSDIQNHYIHSSDLSMVLNSNEWITVGIPLPNDDYLIHGLSLERISPMYQPMYIRQIEVVCKPYNGTFQTRMERPQHDQSIDISDSFLYCLLCILAFVTTFL